MKKHLKKLIAAGNTRPVISKLLEITNELDDKNLHAEIVLISSRYEANMKNKGIGTTSQSYQDTLFAHVNQALLQFIDRLPDDLPQSTSTSSKPVKEIATTSSWWKFVTGTAVVIGMIAGIVTIMDGLGWPPINTQPNDNKVTIDTIEISVSGIDSIEKVPKVPPWPINRRGVESPPRPEKELEPFWENQKYNWVDAKLKGCNQDGYKLPTKKEWESLLNKWSDNKQSFWYKSAVINVKPSIENKNFVFWTADDIGDRAKAIIFTKGNVSFDDPWQHEKYYCLCVPIK